MIGQADFSSAIHFGRLSVQFGNGDFRRRRGVRHGNVKFNFKFILKQLMNVPAFPEPPTTDNPKNETLKNNDQSNQSINQSINRLFNTDE